MFCIDFLLFVYIFLVKCKVGVLKEKELKGGLLELMGVIAHEACLTPQKKVFIADLC